MTDITVGVSLPKTGRYAESAFLQYSHAYNLWIDDVNAAGGLLGRQLKLVWLDDEGDGDKCAANYKQLINDAVDVCLHLIRNLLSLDHEKHVSSTETIARTNVPLQQNTFSHSQTQLWHDQLRCRYISTHLNPLFENPPVKASS